MSWSDRARWIKQWVPFGVRTIGYGTISVTGGPFTRGRVSQWAARQWSRVSIDSLGIVVDTQGVENLPTGSGYMIASNHQSLLDILVLGATFPGDFKWAAKRSIMDIPFLGWHLRLAGHVPVDRRRDKQSAMAVVSAFEGVLRRGKALLVFPEGTRSSDGTIKDFKNGGFYAAVRTDSPVVPVAIEGTYHLMAREDVDTGEVNGRPRVVGVRIGEPIHPDRSLPETERVDDLRDRCREAVVTMHRMMLEEISGLRARDSQAERRRTIDAAPWA